MKEVKYLAYLANDEPAPLFRKIGAKNKKEHLIIEIVALI